MYRRKYRNNKSNGFDSKAEERRWVFLQEMEKAGHISQLRRQVTYELIPSQRINGTVVERPLKYIADFVYVKDGKEIVEDVKGFRTSDYVIKRKLMLFLKGIQIREIKA